MCGIVGFVNYKQDISKYKNILINMNNTLSTTNESEYYLSNHIALIKNEKNQNRYIVQFF